MVSISACHAEDPGSIPGGADFVCIASGQHQRMTLELARDFKQKYAELGADRRLWLQCHALTLARLADRINVISPPGSVGRAQPCGRGFEPDGGCLVCYRR